MKENYTHETFAPGFDPHGNNTNIEREEGLEVAGVNLVGSNEVLLTPMITSPTPARLMMMGNSIHAEEAGDETYALPADKGVVVQAIPDDQLPTDTEGNKAGLLIPERHLACPNADFDMDMFYGLPSAAVIPVHAKPKAHINRQRQGYSRRKAKRAYQARAAHQVKLTRYKRRGRGYLMLLDENGNPVNLKSDNHFAQSLGRAKAGSFMAKMKSAPQKRKGDING